MILAYFRPAREQSYSDLAPVITILPDLKMSAVVLGLCNLIITAANRLGLYYAFLAFKYMSLSSSLQFRFIVPTTF